MSIRPARGAAWRLNHSSEEQIVVAFNSPNRKSQRLVELKFVQNELEVRDCFRQSVITEQEVLRMARVSKIDDAQLLRRLFDEGFRAETVHTLTFFPVAMAAWASGFVTVRERRRAEQAVFSPDVSGNEDSVALFHKWLCQRPSDSLWELWADYLSAIAAAETAETPRSKGRVIWDLANQVAVASGGFLGLGGICTAEQLVLDRIRQ